MLDFLLTARKKKKKNTKKRRRKKKPKKLNIMRKNPYVQLFRIMRVIQTSSKLDKKLKRANWMNN